MVGTAEHDAGAGAAWPVGATYMGDNRCQFTVWAPLAQKVEVHLLSPRDRLAPLTAGDRGYHCGMVEDVPQGSLYVYRLNGAQESPDPASRFQPQGVHGPSQVVDSAFDWHDAGWSGLALPDYVIYELHVGAFSTEGTFEAVIPYLDGLKSLGVTAIELMPMAQFPGGRNWGYDGVYPFAAQNSYGGPQGLKRLVDACHSRGLAVVLDVVYNHPGPEGNCLADFGPYFTERYMTPWGAAINFDGPHGDEVRRFFIDSALHWVTECHVDGLRLDALHAIFDMSPVTFLEELAEAVHQQAQRLGRQIHLFAESDRNDARLIRPPELGGYGLDACWNDDFHHVLHVLLTGEQVGYYRDFGGIQQLAKALREGFIYSGQYSQYRQRRHGSCSRDIPAHRFVVFSQNHDQVGNRMLGERLGQLVSFEELKLAAGLVLLSPFVPLIFMGEEYGETAPFQYFISHSEPALVEATRQGRQQEFAAFAWQGEVPDPQDETTFLRSKLNHQLYLQESKHQVLRNFYRELLRLRRELPALKVREGMEVVGYEEGPALLVRRRFGAQMVMGLFNLGPGQVSLPLPEGRWRKMLDSAEARWLGSGGDLPDEVVAAGESSLVVGAKTFALFVLKALPQEVCSPVILSAAKNPYSLRPSTGSSSHCSSE